MSISSAQRQSFDDSWSDQQLIDGVLAGDTGLYELLMRRYNQRVYRTVRAILRDDSETEDVMQEAYVRAYEHLAEFEGRSSFSTWLTRIAVNESFRRLYRNKKFDPIDISEMSGRVMTSHAENPEQAVATAEAATMLERAILSLPRDYRVVLVMRDMEEMSTAETAQALEITPESVKVRLHRARVRLRHELYRYAGATGAAAFQFHAIRCNRVTKAVMARIAPR